jgi:hypothetical protein
LSCAATGWRQFAWLDDDISDEGSRRLHSETKDGQEVRFSRHADAISTHPARYRHEIGAQEFRLEGLSTKGTHCLGNHPVARGIKDYP